jgi:hypothetical protein
MNKGSAAMESKPSKALIYLSKYLIPLLLIVFVVIYRTNTELLFQMTDEDNFLEWATAILLIIAGIISLVSALQIRQNQDLFFWFFLIFSILCILASLEEISWGQRLLGVESPEYFLEASDQGEINIHNIIQKYTQNIKIFNFTYSFKTKHLTGLITFIYGTCFPLLAKNPKVNDLLTRYQIVIPNRLLAFSFFIGSILMIDIPTGEEEEIGEFLLSICIFLFMLIEDQRLVRKYHSPQKAVEI